MKRKQIVWGFLAVVLLAAGIAYWRLTEPPAHGDDIPEAARLVTVVKQEAKVESEEEKTGRKLQGVWQDEYQGKRTMTLNPDGTGIMAVELSGVQALLFAAKLRFDMKWSLDGKKITKKTVGGEPTDKVNLILNTMGNTAEDTIVELTDDRLLLLDKNGKTTYDWRAREEYNAPMKILFLHGWHATPGGSKPMLLAQRGHEVIQPKLPDDDFDEAVRIAQEEFDKHLPDVVIGQSRGGTVAMNIDSGATKLVLLSPGWNRWGTAKAVKPGTVILHSRVDDVVPFAASEKLLRNSGLSAAALLEVGNDHWLHDSEALEAMVRACENGFHDAGM